MTLGGGVQSAAPSEGECFQPRGVPTQVQCGKKERKSQEELPVVKGPSEMKKDPMVRPTAAANLKNQNL